MSDIPVNPTATTPAAPSRGPSIKQLAIVVAILAAGIVVTALTSDVKKVSEPGVRLVNDAPYLDAQIGLWQGGPEEGLSEQERSILPQDTEGARRLYKDNAGHQIYCSIILAGRDVTSIHRPEMCLPGQGWTIESEHVVAIPVASARGGVLRVMRMNTSREVRLEDGRTLPYHAIFVYWFVGKGRETPYHWQRILWTTKDRVLHNTNHRWAYILINEPAIPTSAQEDVKQAEDAAMKLTATFIQNLYPTLIPK